MSRQASGEGVKNPSYQNDVTDGFNPQASTATFNEIVINENLTSSTSIDRHQLTKYATVVENSPPHPLHNGTSDLETLMHMIKANIGTGVLAMPLAFKYGGLALSGVSLWIMAVMCIHCMHILLNCYKHVMKDFTKQKEDDAKPSDSIGYDDVVMLVAKGKCSPQSKLPKLCRIVVSIVSIGIFRS